MENETLKKPLPVVKLNTTQKPPENTEEKQRLPQWFKPGQSGNPAGRPLGAKNFTTKVREALMAVATDKNGKSIGKTYEALLVQSILTGAIKGDTQLAKLIWNYLDGMPVQKNVNENNYPQAEKVEEALNNIFNKYGNKGNTTTGGNS